MKKKVLFVLEAFDKGGIEKVTLDIVNNLNPEKYDITVKTIWFGGHCQSQLKEHIKIEPFFKKYRKGIMRLFIYLPKTILYKLYIKEKYDIEIAAGDGIPSRIIAGSTNTNSKKVSWIHMDVLKRGSQLRELKNKNRAIKFYSPFDLIACVSNDCKNSFEKKFGFSEKTKVIYNPIPNEEIVELSNEVLDIEINKDTFNVVTVGRLVEQKGYDRLLKVHKKLMDENIKYKLYILGDGEKRSELEEYIKYNNLKNTVEILGFKSNPYKYIKNCDLFISTSRDEAYPTVAIETTILGTPMIATNCAGVNEILDNGRYGIIVENDENAIYNGFKDILTDKKKYKYYKENIKERQNYFNFKKSINDFENIILK